MTVGTTAKTSIFTVGAAVWLLVMMAGYYDFRVNGTERYREGHAIPTMVPMGIDYQAVYSFGDGLKQGMEGYLFRSNSDNPNVYPPFVTVALLPLTAFEPDTAYHLFVVLLASFLAGTVYLCLSERRWPEVQSRLLVALAITALLYHSYPVNFSLERGNSDIIAAFFIVAALCCMRKGRAVAAVALLTVATQIKVYPAVIAVILLVRLGWRPLIGYVVANLALLFVLGVSGFDNFVTLLAKISGSPYIWPGNHSLHAFVNYLAQNGLIPTESESLVRLGCYAGILLLFSAAAVKYVYVMMKLKSAAVTDHRRKTFSPIELGIIGMSFSMMSLLPSVSHDYKLSIQIVPFLLLLNGLSDDSFGRRVEVLTLIAILATCVAYLFIPRYVPFGLYLPDPASRDLIQSKTPGVIVAFACYLYLTVRGGVAMEEREISRGEA